MTATRIRRWLAAGVCALVLLASAGAGALNTYLASCAPCPPWVCLLLEDSRCTPPAIVWTE